MQFGTRPRPPILRKQKGPAPLSVGRHVFVNQVSTRTEETGDVRLTDERDTRTLRELADGQEVEILGWRQRPRVRYHVRCMSGGAEGWLAAECLRASRDPLPDTSSAADGTQQEPEPPQVARPSRSVPSRKNRPRAS